MTRLTIRDACERLRCSRWTLDRLFKAGKLTKITQHGKVYVDAAELDEYIRRTYPAPTSPPPPAHPAMTAEELADLLAKVTRIEQKLAGTSRSAA